MQLDRDALASQPQRIGDALLEQEVEGAHGGKSIGKAGEIVSQRRCEMANPLWGYGKFSTHGSPALLVRLAGPDELTG